MNTENVSPADTLADRVEHLERIVIDLLMMQANATLGAALAVAPGRPDPPVQFQARLGYELNTLNCIVALLGHAREILACVPGHNVVVIDATIKAYNEQAELLRRRIELNAGPSK